MPRKPASSWVTVNQVPITTSSLPPVRTGARRAQMVVLNLGHDGVPRGLSPFCSQLSRYLRVAMMMPFICSYRNKKAQLSSFLRVACGRQKVSWWPIGASIVATCISASRRLRVCVECLIGKQKKPILFKVTEPSSIPYSVF